MESFTDLSIMITSSLKSIVNKTVHDFFKYAIEEKDLNISEEEFVELWNKFSQDFQIKGGSVKIRDEEGNVITCSHFMTKKVNCDKPVYNKSATKQYESNDGKSDKKDDKACELNYKSENSEDECKFITMSTRSNKGMIIKVKNNQIYDYRNNKPNPEKLWYFWNRKNYSLPIMNIYFRTQTGWKNYVKNNKELLKSTIGKIGTDFFVAAAKKI